MYTWQSRHRHRERLRRTGVWLAALVCLATLILLPRPAGALRTERVVIVVIDGPRASEFLEDPTHEHIPRIWNELRPQGYISHGFYNLDQTKTVIGHANLITGTHQDIDVEGTERPCLPTFWEYLRHQTGLADDQALFVTYKKKLLNLSYSTYHGYGAEDSATVIGPLFSDPLCIERFIEFAEVYEPVLSLIALGHTDVMGHECSEWNWYVGAIRQADNLTGQLWEWIQSHPAYANRTALLITADHGRHVDDWCGHGCDCDGCRHLPLVALGPDFRAGVEDFAHSADLRDICETACALLGVDPYWSTGRVLEEIFRDPADIPLPPPAPADGWRLVAESPAIGASRIVVSAPQAGPMRPAARWQAALFDLNGRRLSLIELRGEQLRDGWMLPHPDPRAETGLTWLELRLRDRERLVRLSRPVLWIR